MNKFEQFDQVGKDLFMLGLVSSGSGSLSIREGEKIYITKQDALLGHLKEDDIIEAPLNEESESGPGAARELPVHRAIYKETPACAIIHAYPAYGIALSINTENKILPQDMKGQIVLKSIPVVRAKAIMPGREKMGIDELIRFLPPIYKSGYPVCIVKEYGSFAAGKDLFETLNFTICLEDSCKISAIAKSLITPEKPKEQRHERRSAIPPSIGVMDRGRGYKRGFGR